MLRVNMSLKGMRTLEYGHVIELCLLIGESLRVLFTVHQESFVTCKHRWWSGWSIKRIFRICADKLKRDNNIRNDHKLIFGVIDVLAGQAAKRAAFLISSFSRFKTFEVTLALGFKYSAIGHFPTNRVRSQRKDPVHHRGR